MARPCISINDSKSRRAYGEFVTPVPPPQWDFQKPWASRLAIVKVDYGHCQRRTLAGIPFPATKMETLQVHRRIMG